MLHLSLLATLVAEASDEWTVLQVDQVHVQCRDLSDGSGSECVAVARIDAEVQPVSDILRDLPSWPRRFDNVVNTVLLGPVGQDDLYAIDIRLPWPLGSRSMVARVHHSDDGDGHHEVVVQAIDGDMLWTRASWEIYAVGEQTEIAYRWHTEALANLPGWIRRSFLRRTGHHVMWGLALAAQSKPEAPPEPRLGG